MRSIIGNKKALQYLFDSIKSDELSHAYLFVGPLSVGKTTVAREVARRLFCEKDAAIDCDCQNCRKVRSGIHPDLHFLSGTNSGIDDVRKITSQLSMRPYQSKYRIAIISHAQDLTISALNSFLKTLEEPKDNTIIILTTENKSNLLETIVSRTRQVNFGVVSDKEIFEYLNQEVGVKKNQAVKLTSLATGRVGIALSEYSAGLDVDKQFSLAENFLRVYRSEDMSDKFVLASKLAGDKDNLAQNLSNIASVARLSLLKSVEGNNLQEIFEGLSVLDSLVTGEDLLKKNINVRLIFESILLRSI